MHNCKVFVIILLPTWLLNLYEEPDIFTLIVNSEAILSIFPLRQICHLLDGSTGSLSQIAAAVVLQFEYKTVDFTDI